MPEFLSHPDFLPAFIGFLGGGSLAFFLLSLRLSSLRAAAMGQEKAAAKTIAKLKAEEAVLRSDISTMHSTESRLIKRQGELEALAGNSQERHESLSQLLRQTDATLQDGLIKLENAVLNAVRKSQRPKPSIRLAPLAQGQKETPREKGFEGLVMEQPATKAESAANALRAALNEPFA